MNKQTNKNQISSLAPLLLFVVFTTCVLSVLLTGADVYQKFSNRDQAVFQHRTAAQYLTTRIRQSDTEGMLFVGNFSDDPADQDSVSLQSSSGDFTGSSISGNTLFLREELGGRTFYTRIYCNDGYLRELFAEAGLDFSPTMGEKILEVQNLTFTQQDDLLYVEITYTDASSQTLILHRHTGKEVSL